MEQGHSGICELGSNTLQGKRDSVSSCDIFNTKGKPDATYVDNPQTLFTSVDETA